LGLLAGMLAQRGGQEGLFLVHGRIEIPKVGGLLTRVKLEVFGQGEGNHLGSKEPQVGGNEGLFWSGWGRILTTGREI